MSKRLTNATKRRTAKINGKEVEVYLRDEADQSVFNEIFEEREYRSLDPIIADAKCPILDLGAHIGLFTIYCRMINSEADIWSYEPNKENFDLMKQNFRENRIKGVRLKNLAIGRIDGLDNLYISPDSHNHSLIFHDQEYVEKVSVYSTTLDRAIEKAGGKISLLKMDIEGAEAEVFKSVSDETLRKIEHYYIEYHTCGRFDPNEIVNRLKSVGFKAGTRPSHYDKSMGFIAV